MYVRGFPVLLSQLSSAKVRRALPHSFETENGPAARQTRQHHRPPMVLPWLGLDPRAQSKAFDYLTDTYLPDHERLQRGIFRKYTK